MRRYLATLCVLFGFALGSTLAPQPALGGAFAPSQSGWTVVTKTADETISSDSTLSNDSTLLFTVAANTKYRFRSHVMFRTGATPDFKWQVTSPASPTLDRVHRISAAALGTPVTQRVLSFTNLGVVSELGTAAAGADDGGFVQLEGVLHNGANSGSVAFQWAQDTSDASNTTVLAGSYVEYKAVQ